MTRLNAAAMKSAREFASVLADLEQRVQRMERTASLSRSSIEGDAIYAYDGEQAPTMVIGSQFDGTNGASVLTGPTPPEPSAPIIASAPGGLTVSWDGFYADIDAVSPMDFLRVDVTVGNSESFDPIATPPSTAIVSPRGGSSFIALPPGRFYVALVARTYAGVASPPSALMPGEVIESAVVVTPPTDTPTPTVVGGIDSITVSWPPSIYSTEVHVSQSPSFSPTLGDRTTFVGATDGTSVTVVRLPNGDTLNYTSAYYVRTIAYNEGGAATASATVTTSPVPGSLQLNEGGTTKTTRLRVTAPTDVNPDDPANDPALIVGPPDGSHIRMDGNEMWSMASASTRGRLGLQGRFFGGWDYGVLRVVTNAAGEGLIPHDLNALPTVVLMNPSVIGGRHIVRLAARTTTNFTVRVINPSDGTVAPGLTIDVHWLALLA